MLLKHLHKIFTDIESSHPTTRRGPFNLTESFYRGQNKRMFVILSRDDVLLLLPNEEKNAILNKSQFGYFNTLLKTIKGSCGWKIV